MLIKEVHRRISCRQDFFTYLCLIGAFFLAGLLRFFYFQELQASPLPWLTSHDPVFDQYNFVSTTQDILKHSWVGSYATEYSPAYSYLIAILFKCFGETLNVVFMFQIVLGIFTVYVMYLSANLLFQNKKVGLLAAMITALYSPFIFYEGAVLRAAPIAYLNVLSFYVFLKAVKNNRSVLFFCAGLLIGLSMILRINGLAPAVGIYILFGWRQSIQKKWVCLLLFFLGVMMVVMPLTLRNKKLGHDVMISSYGPSVFWLGNTHDANGIGLHQTALQTQLSLEAGGNIGRTFQIWIREIKKYPRAYAQLYFRKVKMFFNGYEIPANLSYDLARENSDILRMGFFNFSIISPLAITGLFLMFRKYPYGGAFYLFWGVLSLSAILFHIQGRYRIPSIPFFILVASYTLFWMTQALEKKAFFSLAGVLVGCFIVSMFTRPDHVLIKKYFRLPVRSVDYTNLAVAYSRWYEVNKDKLKENEKKALLLKALENRRKALRICEVHRKPRHLVSMGLLYFELQQYQDALKVFLDVLRFQPDNALAKDYVHRIKELDL